MRTAISWLVGLAVAGSVLAVAWFRPEWIVPAASSVQGNPSPVAVTPVPEASPGAVPEAVSSLLEPGDLIGSGRAIAHPHGEQVCASGCAASRHPTPPLTWAKFQRLLARWQQEPLGEPTPALEELLFYGRQSLVYLRRVPPEALSEKRRRFLEEQLRRTHVVVGFRVVDEHGVVRVFLPPTRVPLDIRHEYLMDTHDLQPLVTSGTVKRVGLYHLWQRI